MPSQVYQPPNDLPPGFIAAHGRVLADKATQFQLSPLPKITQPVWPKWLVSLGQMLGHLLKPFGAFGVYIFWGLIIIVVLAVATFILRELGYINWARRPKIDADADADTDDWNLPDAPARKLLTEADGLAAQGHYAEAAHLLLLRSFEDIAARRPTALTPAMTAREMAQNTAIPQGARAMFGEISRHVEATLFGGRPLDMQGWHVCRAAYSSFARSREWI